MRDGRSKPPKWFAPAVIMAATAVGAAFAVLIAPTVQ